MFSDAVCSSGNKVGIRYTFKLPWRMPSRDVFIWCCVWCWKCQYCHKLTLSPIRNITYSCTHCSDLCNEQLINPFRLSYILSPGSLVCSVMCGISTTYVNRKDFNEVWKAVLNRRDYNNSGDLLDFTCGGISLSSEEAMCSWIWDLRPGTWIYWPHRVKTQIF